jgi:putative ATPase
MTEPQGLGLPLAVRMRPQKLSEIVGQDQLLTPRSPIRQLIEGGTFEPHPPAVILWGPPGSGKTTLAYLIGKRDDRIFVEVSATSSSVKELREIIENAKAERALTERETVLFVDEVHRFSKTQQDVLLPAVENRTITLVAATAENPSFSIVTPLLSRSILVRLAPIDHSGIERLVKRALKDPRGLNGRFGIDRGALQTIVNYSNADARKALTILETAATAVAETAAEPPAQPKLSGPKAKAKKTASARKTITNEHVRNSLTEAFLRYDRDGDEHYDVASAFIKSMRGSDVNAALHYLARMLAGGEDPRFIARRIIIAASEEIAMADPSALLTAVAAAQATELIGLPEARIVLAQAVVHVASAPKSNASYLAFERAAHDIQSGKIGSVPIHLRSSAYPDAKKYGNSVNYRYAHDFPDAIAPQQYLPDELKDAEYYYPNDRGYEAQVKSHYQFILQHLKGQI